MKRKLEIEYTFENPCRCGHNEFTFIGVQHGSPSTNYFLNLFNCGNCQTTVGQKVLKTGLDTDVNCGLQSDHAATNETSKAQTSKDQ